MRTINNPLALAVLAYLSRQPMHPYELSRTLREHGKERSIKFTNGSVYMVINQLAKAGFVAEVETSRDGNRPERTVYALTDTGRREWREWLRELVEEPRHEHPQFVVALSLIAALSPDEVVVLLTERLRRMTEQVDEIRAAMAEASALGVHALFQVDEEYRLAMAEAETSFLQSFLHRITDPDTGWGPLWAATLAATDTRGEQS